MVVVHKQRQSGTQTQVTRIVGEVRDRPCLIIDDMISTGGTIAKTIEALLDAGARPKMTVAVTHGLFIQDARQKLSHESIQQILATDTISINAENWSQLQIVSVAPLIAQMIRKNE